MHQQGQTAIQEEAQDLYNLMMKIEEILNVMQKSQEQNMNLEQLKIFMKAHT